MRFALWTSAVLIAEAVNVELIEEQTVCLTMLAIIFVLWDVIEFATKRKEQK